MRRPYSTRIQLCGRVQIELDGRPVDGLRGGQSRLLLGYLVVSRARPRDRDELVYAVWGDDAPPAVDTALSVLLSRLRQALGWEAVDGRRVVQLRLPADTFVDVEAAVDSLHLAESALRAGNSAAAWSGALIARYISDRTFFAGFDRPWVEEWRRELSDVHVRALECFARACLAIGGTELDGADRATRLLADLAPYRESAHALRMQALMAAGNLAEALLAFERLRARLREELGVDPGPQVRALHQRILELSSPEG
jgi:SARP family transcriptional regulator, regulator of embCAB operon